MEDQHQLHQRRSGGAGGLVLPPGFRFHPSDEEIITYYLTNKVCDGNFTAITIGEADINKSEPWELPFKAKMGEKEWYFYCRKDRKYPTGLRANRATESGYWKATGKDRKIYHGASSVPVLLGMKKTLVFYMGRAPSGVKTNWVMHEYRLDGKGGVPCPAASSNTSPRNLVLHINKEEWVVCRVCDKSLGIRKEPELAPVSAPPHRMASMSDREVDLRSMSFPMPTQFHVGINDLTMNSNGFHPLMGDPSTSLYSTDSMESSVLLNPLLPSLLPPLLPMGDMGNMRVEMNNDYFGNSTSITEQASFYRQVGTQTTGDLGFMAELDISQMAIMLLHDVGVLPS